MPARRVIRLGDPTTHGGVVVSASGTVIINGKQVARVGDSVTCPIPGHGVVTIIEGDPNWQDNGRPIALEGHKTSCGASLISTLSTLFRSPGGGGAGVVGAAGGLASALESTIAPTSANNSMRYDEQVQAIDAKTSEPIPDLAYYIEAPNGAVYTGHTDEQGLCERVMTYAPAELAVWFGEDAEKKRKA